MRICIVTDIHYVPGTQGQDVGNRRMDMGDCLLRRALYTAKNIGPVDALVFLGDLVQDGNSDTAMQAWETLRDIARQFLPDTPMLVVPGNHDANPSRMLEVFGTPGELTVDGYRLVSFVDPYDKDDVCYRREEEFARLQREAAAYPGRLIVLQHNPMNPVIESSYPYMLTNRAAVMDAYAQTGVLLSLSAHYHAGQSMTEVNGVRYFTAPALCEHDKYTFTLVDVNDASSEITVQPTDYSLFLRDFNVADMHCHTEFAYCANDITAKAAIERCREFGLAGMGFAEHSSHLYINREDYNAKKHIFEPDTWKATKNGRMQEYRRLAESLRDDFVQFGFEVDIDIDGNAILHEEDRQWADYLIGAIHVVPGVDGSDSPAVQNQRFLAECEKLLACDVDILAHPFRWFIRNRQPAPRELYEPLAQMLLDTNTAAEINYHTNKPQREFFELCKGMGVRIVYGTDAHALYEAGNLLANLLINQ